MAERRGRFTNKLFTWLVIFLIGGAAGWYVRDQQYENIQEELDRVKQELRDTREQLSERSRRAGEGIRRGAEAAADSTKAAVREMMGDTAN